MTGAARALAERVLGRPAGDVDFELDPGLGAGRFAYAAAGGRLRVRGGDLPALGAGLHHYLTDVAGVQVTWDDPGAAHGLPVGDWPDAPETGAVAAVALRTYFNVVTTGYTAPFWSWSRWEREIDWMALHGINAPLMVLGHEAVLAAAFAELGAGTDEIAAWLGGAPYLPWTLMGSTSSWGGPLPRRWPERRLELARRVLARQRELGMTPVLPAFGGHVPDALGGAGSRRTTWQDFSTALLEPGSAAFDEVAAAVARRQRALLGTDHLYAADPLIESVPPSADPDYLARLGATIWRGLRRADPDATWVMQAWPFHFKRAFWTADRIAAFVRDVPADRMLLLDLWAEHAPVWDDGRGIADRPWAWCAIHNFGGRFSLHGDLRGLVREGRRVEASPQRARLRGFGLVPEATEQNPAFYELAATLPWDPPDDVEAWLAGFVIRRYRLAGAGEDVRGAALEAWRILAATLYGPGATRSIPSPVIARPWDADVPFRSQRLAGEELDPDRPPSANIDAEADPRVEGDLSELARAAELLADVAERLGPDGPWAGDLTDVVTHVVAQGVRAPVRAAVRASRAGDRAGVERAATEVLAAVDGLEELAGTRADRLTGAWVRAAREWGDDAEERDVLGRDARRILSVWGRPGSGLHDYSGRHWMGLLGGLYRPRWAAWFALLAELSDGEWALTDERLARYRERVAAIEDAWVAGPHDHATTPTGDVVATARRLLTRATTGPERDAGAPAGTEPADERR
ncbi:alpha-N-acetylglucosaminidase [Nonomuraea sp. NPDC004297]